MMAERQNWFDQGGGAYARFRPEYPLALADQLASLCVGRRLAVDVGCGSGQLSRLLAAHFDEVIGFDPSESQIAHAEPAANLRYLCAPAEALPLADGCVDLITAAQAAHWFDLPKFHAEARRVAAPGALLALVSYGVLHLPGALGERFAHFYTQEIGPFWPAERQLVDSGYATLDFPFEELTAPALSIALEWSLDEFLGYVSTWSAVRSAREAGREELLHAFAADLAGLWGDSGGRHVVRWPLNMRLGRL